MRPSGILETIIPILKVKLVNISYPMIQPRIKKRIPYVSEIVAIILINLLSSYYKVVNSALEALEARFAI